MAKNRINYTPKKLLEDIHKPLDKAFYSTDITGMTVVQSPYHGGRMIRFKYRSEDKGKKYAILIGKFPEISLQMARTKWQEIADRVLYGLPPEEEKPLNVDNSFGEMYRSWRKITDVNISYLTIKKREIVWNVHLAKLDNKAIEEITPDFVVDFLQPLLAQEKYDMAQTVAAVLRQVIEYAVFRQKLPYNPLSKIAKFIPKPKHKHYASFNDETLKEDMIKLFETMKNEKPVVQCLMYMHFFTLLRNAEVRNIKFEMLEDGYFYTKTKTMEQFKCPITRQAQQVIEYLKAHRQSVFSDYIFAVRNTRHPISELTLNKIFDKYGYRDKLRVHGIRTLGRQWFAMCPDVKDSIAEMCLSHVVGNAVEQAYNRGVYFDERKRVMQKWSDFVEECAGSNFDFIRNNEDCVLEQKNL